MQFDWNQYLTLANKLALSSGDEASLRSAISRAYYCAFNLALAKAKINGYRPKSDETVEPMSFCGSYTDETTLTEYANN